MRAFVSYSHKDIEAHARLIVHLSNLTRDRLLEAWYDREILAGDVLDNEIDQELEAADLFLLMVSPDFIASNYCVEREMQRALERHDAGEARVVPIIVEPCDWAAMPQLRRLKAVPTDGTPISDWANENTAYLNVVQEIRRIVTAHKFSSVEASSITGLASEPSQPAPVYRVQRDFDEIDRSEYRDSAFVTIKDYFQRAIDEIKTIDGLRGRFVNRSVNSFGGTIVNQARQNGIAHITVHCRNDGYALGDIYYSFDENASENTANGGFNVSSDEYEQYLEVTMAMFGHEDRRMQPEQAAEYLWKQFIEQAGITYA